MFTVYRDLKKNSLAHRARVGMIVRRSDETKGYRVYIRKDNVVVVTQHVKNIQTLSELQSEQPKLRAREA